MTARHHAATHSLPPLPPPTNEEDNEKEKQLEDASTPDEKVEGAGEENLNLGIKELEKSEQKLKGVLEDYVESDSILRNRMKELELSHKALLVMIDQLNVKLNQVENAHVRIKGKLRDIQGDLISLVENQKKSEKKQKEKLHWLQEQLKTKEDEIKSQSEYFEHYKQRQRQQTAVLRKRDCYLQGEVSRLEKQVRDLNAHIALLTSELEEGMVQHLQQKLQSVCSGTQGCKHPGVEEMEWKTCTENAEHDVKRHCEAFQQNLKFLREKEEDTRREQAGLLTELQCSQDTEDFLRTKLEESHHHVFSLKLPEIKLQEKVEELLDGNRTSEDQGSVKLKKKKEKYPELKRLAEGDSRVNVVSQLNGDLIQDEVQNLKWRAVLDSLRSRATQTPVVLLHDKESETPACTCDGLKKMEELPEEPGPVLECSSSAFVKLAGLPEAEQVTLGPQRASTLEGSFTLLRCTPSHHAAGLLPPCSAKFSINETIKETKDEETFFLLKTQSITLPVKTFPASVVEALMRKKLQLTWFELGRCHTAAFTSVKKVRSLSFCEANTDLWSDGLCIVAKGGFYDKAPELLHAKLPSAVAEIFASSLEGCNMEKHWGNMQILPKSISENICLDKDFDDEKYHQKIFTGRAKREEIQNDKAQQQQLTCDLEESPKVFHKTELFRPGKQGVEAKENLCSTQIAQSFSVAFKDFKKCFEGSPEQVDEENISENCIPDVNSRCNGEDLTEMEEKEKQAQKPTHQTRPSSNIGLKKMKDQTLKLCEPNEENFLCQKIAAKNMQHAYSQKFFWSDEKRYPLNLLFPLQERAVCLRKLFLPGNTFYECFCHLSSLEAGNECNVKISVLEKAVAACSQRIFLLMQENENYSKKVCILQQENDRYAQMMRALEEEMDAYFQYVLAVDEANIVSFQNLINEKEVAGGCYNNFTEENTMTPGTFLVETFPKNLSYVEEKNRNSEKDSLTIASNKLHGSVLSLNGRKMRYFQLLSDLKEERSRCFKEMAKLLQDNENYVAKCNELVQEREKNLQRIALSEGEKETLLGHLAEIKCEQDKYRILVSELQDCKTSCYQTISDLQEEKCVLKREIDRIKQETSEQLEEFQKANANFILENKNLKELMSSLGFTCEELRKEKSIGTKKNIVKLKEGSQQHGLKPKKVGTACSVTQTEEQGVLPIDPSDYSPGKKGIIFESYSMMKEQVRKAEEELKVQQKELEKSKKEAQKWYRELGFAETRYEEMKTRLTQALSELDCLKQEVEDKMQRKQHCKPMPVYTLKDAQEKEVNKIASKRLEQQVLTLKAQLRDQAALQNQFHDLQNEVELLQAQLCEKEKELQKRKSEVKLTLAPLKVKLACLTQKCQERNSFIRRIHGEFQRQGIINSAFDEEVKNLVDDMTLAEYIVAFTPVCDQEVLPSSTDISQANGQPEDHVACAKGNGMTGSIPENSQPGVDGLHSSHITPNVCAGSPMRVTSPERIIALHRELRENHHKNFQIPSVVPSGSKLRAGPNPPVIPEEAPWPVLSGMKDAVVPPEPGKNVSVTQKKQ
ncbi:janus kinase and microtubule-interacting protein 1 isoform X2 [Corvus kubaryi]|uniref:janus kinase and microtubule-interacting protein 1 isoform X2 n=1 Tax=Corvus kubaryi TaxID=68294 RepID=UPI001C03EB66|nr:janus kinase and microtubule-interacting protein 1 isoform X2 [Corvus kubaryi]